MVDARFWTGKKVFLTGHTGFKEKPKGDDAWINGGFFVMQPEIFDYIDGDETLFEREPLERLAAEGYGAYLRLFQTAAQAGRQGP